MMADVLAGNITENLLKELARVEKEVDSWSTEQKQKFDDLTISNNENVNNFNVSKANLNDKIESLEKQKGVNNEKHNAQQAEVVAVQNEIGSLQSESLKLPEAVSVARNDRDSCVSALKQHQNDITRLTEMRTHTMNELTRGVLLYKKLGLEFEHTSAGDLRLLFSLLHESCPQLRAALTVRIDSENIYHVTECTLSVEALPELVRRLNADNDFSAFVKAIRREFKQLVSGTQA